MVTVVADIVPELLELIQRDFSSELNKNQKLKNIRILIESGEATYSDASVYAIEVGEILSKVFKKHIRSEVLPEGKMYYNIADRILNVTLSNNHEIVAKISAEIQEHLNKSIGLGLKGIEPPINQNRINSLVNRVANEELFDDVAWILQEPVVNFTQSIVDDTILSNVNFQGESGLNPTVTRTVTGHDPCAWCRSMAGVYKYPNVPKAVYTRHDRCRCIVEYDPGDARRQNVWSKDWR